MNGETQVVNIHESDFDVYIGRTQDGGHMENTKIENHGWLGNPFVVVEDGSRDQVIELFRELFYDRIEQDEEFRKAVKSLKGKRLGCFCAPKACHGDVVKEYLDKVQNATEGDMK